MDKFSGNSDNVVDFPFSLEARFQALEASGYSTDEATDQILFDCLTPLRLQANRLLDAIKAMQVGTSQFDQRAIGLIETEERASR